MVWCLIDLNYDKNWAKLLENFLNLRIRSEFSRTLNVLKTLPYQK